jgi:hypothetical protein
VNVAKEAYLQTQTLHLPSFAFLRDRSHPSQDFLAAFVSFVFERLIEIEFWLQYHERFSLQGVSYYHQIVT